AGPVRRDRHREHLRRHPLGRGRGGDRRPRARRIGERRRRRPRDLRARARLGTRHRGTRRRQPGRDAPLRRPAARARARTARARPHPGGGRRPRGRGRPDGRSRRHRDDGGIHRVRAGRVDVGNGDALPFEADAARDREPELASPLLLRARLYALAGAPLPLRFRRLAQITRAELQPPTTEVDHAFRADPERPVAPARSGSGGLVPELLLRLPLADPRGAGRAPRRGAHLLRPLRPRGAAEAGRVVSAASIAYPGRDGAHAATACEQLFPGEAVLPLPTFSAVAEATVAGEVRFGVLPIESSLSGAVAETHDLLHAGPLSIVAETVLRIRHHLVAPGSATLEQIRVVRSHPAALDQCRRLLAAMPWATAIAAPTTAEAAAQVAEAADPSEAAIAGDRAAPLYGLTVVAEDVGDHPN